MAGTGKSAASRVPPKPDPDQMAADALVVSIVAGISFVIATVIFGFFGGLGISLANALSGGRTLKMVCVGVGLAVGLGLIGYLLRANEDRLRARHRMWYRGAWIGTFLSLAIIILMYYFPWIVIPAYCPPGAPCEV